MGELPFDIQRVVTAGLGLFTFYCFSVALTAFIWSFVAKKYRNGSGNRRSDNNETWPSKMLIRMDMMSKDISEINHALKNGLKDEITSMRNTITKCHELNAIREHELHKKDG
jgi:hypothetical protein